MQLPPERKNLTIQETADMLNVRRERVWKLLGDGVLTARPSKLDGRQKLIPREQVDALLREEGYRPRRSSRRSAPRTSDAGQSSAVPTPPRRWPKTIGIVSDGSLPSSESEEYLREHLHGNRADAG